MPELDGLQIIEKLRQRGDNTPVVVMADEGAGPRAISEALERGPTDYIAKPVPLVSRRCFRHLLGPPPGSPPGSAVNPLWLKGTRCRSQRTLDNVSKISARSLITRKVQGPSSID